MTWTAGVTTGATMAAQFNITEAQAASALQPGAIIPWTDLSSVPLVFNPAMHVHAISEITGLTDALNAKQATLVSGTSLKTVNGNSLLGAGDVSVVSVTNLAWVAATRTISSDTGTDAVISVVDGTNAGLMTVGDKTKLDGIAAGATQNALDSFLLARGNHTGTQLANTISDFASAVTNNAAVLANTAKQTNATHTGDVTGSGALTIGNDVVTNAKLANMAANTLKGNNTGATADPGDLSVTQVKTLLAYTAADVGAAAASHSHIAANISDFNTAADARIAAAGINALIDVVIASPVIGDVLKWDGTNWVNGVDATSGGGGGGGDVNGPASSNDNEVARFDSATGKIIQTSAMVLSDTGVVTLPALTVPAAPATPGANKMSLYISEDTGTQFPAFIAANGAKHGVQVDLAEFNIARFQPAANSAAIVGDGSLPLTATGTSTAVAFAATNLYRALRRVEALVTVAATTAVAGYRATNNAWRVGRTADAPGGFLNRMVWGPATGVATATTRAFCGMLGVSTAPTDVEPSTLINCIGMGWGAADANIQLIHNDGTGAATKIDLGVNFPVPTADRGVVYELQLYSPNSLTQSVRYRVIRYNTDNRTIAAEAVGTLTTDIPAASAILGPRVWMSVGGTSSVVGVALMGASVSTDY